MVSWTGPEVERVGKKEIEIKLTFSGSNIASDSVLTLTVGSEAIDNYNGPALTTEISVSATTEAELAEFSKALVASTLQPLTGVTLDGAKVTLTLSGWEFTNSISKIINALTISGYSRYWHRGLERS